MSNKLRITTDCLNNHWYKFVSLNNYENRLESDCTIGDVDTYSCLATLYDIATLAEKSTFMKTDYSLLYKEGKSKNRHWVFDVSGSELKPPVIEYLVEHSLTTASLLSDTFKIFEQKAFQIIGRNRILIQFKMHLIIVLMICDGFKKKDIRQALRKVKGYESLNDYAFNKLLTELSDCMFTPRTFKAIQLDSDIVINNLRAWGKFHKEEVILSSSFKEQSTELFIDYEREKNLVIVEYEAKMDKLKDKFFI